MVETWMGWTPRPATRPQGNLPSGGSSVRSPSKQIASITEERIEEIIGYHFASLVSGNNMPDMSGDPRNRLHPHTRRKFDVACESAAKYIMEEIAAAPTQVGAA